MDSPSATVQQAGCVCTVHIIASGEANGHLARAACRGEVEKMPRMPLGGCWPAAFTRTVIIGSKNTISATTPQTKGRKNYNFESWSVGGAQTHDVIAPATATTYTARFRSRPATAA
jgi:hypothetical protein